MKPRSAYTISTRPGFICLADKNEGRSLTNDSEIVIADLRSRGYDLANNRVIYRDTGVWDEMLVSNGAFAGCRSINAADLHAALAKLIA